LIPLTINNKYKMVLKFVFKAKNTLTTIDVLEIFVVKTEVIVH
jgi:hypothetical protein